MARYNAIVKTAEDKFLKYRNINNLLRFTAFLDSKHTGWCWFNVYDSKTRLQLASFTNKKHPVTRTL